MTSSTQFRFLNFLIFLQTGNHDTSRVATRVSEKFVNAVNMLLLLLPGTPFTYYGEEIGMHDVNVSWEQTQDPAGKRWGQVRSTHFRPKESLIVF